MIKKIGKYPQRVSQTDQRISLHFTLPVADVPTNAEQNFFQDLCRSAIEAQGWEPCKEPIIQVLRRTESHLMLECLIDLFPPVKLPASLELTVEAPPIKAPQPEEIMSRIEALQLRFGKTEKVERPARWGDMVRLDVIGICEGLLVPQSVQDSFWLSLQEKNGPLAAGLVGAQAGQQKRIAYTLAKDFAYQPWQGASATYVVYVHEVQSLQVPVVSDLPVLSDLPNVHDEESLFATLHEEVREMHQAQWQTRLRQRVLSTLLKVTPMTVPAVWVEESFDALWQATDGKALDRIAPHFELSLQEQSAVFEKGLGSWQKHAHLKQKVKQDLACQLLLWAVIREHKLQLSESKIENTLSALGAPLHLSAQQVWANLQEDRQDQRFLNQLSLDHAERYLVKQARIRHGDEMLKVS
jgi:FKBP-type peptidyl-prolyl cis-trans isomerase (trigger factor)